MATNPLTDLIPGTARKYVYGTVLLAALVFGAWQAANGDIETFVGALITALASGLALSNVQSVEGGDEFPDEHYLDGH